MKPYIFTERNGIHIIDLQKTSKALDEAIELVRDKVAEGGSVLFVGTKRQAQETIQLEATRCGMPYVTARWLGGMLTNWRTIRQRIAELERLERMRDAGEFSRITKKEALLLTRKIDRLEALLGGVRNMATTPDLLFAVDVNREETAIHEANLLDVPVIAMVDTNCDPRNIDYIIPSNDDAIRAIKLLVSLIAEAVVEGKAIRKEEEVDVEAAETVLRSMADEPELSDEELLGEATLAKLSSQAVPSEDDIETEEVAEGELEEESAEAPEMEAETEEVEDEVEETESIEAVAAEAESEPEVPEEPADEDVEEETNAGESPEPDASVEAGDDEQNNEDGEGTE
jgi:small subunit ribosomal protein S2